MNLIYKIYLILVITNIMQNKYTIIILVVLIFISVGVSRVLAYQENKIYEVNLNYDKGEISLASEIIARNGYALDRKIQPEAGYKAEVLSLADDVLYSFQFEVPNIQCSDSIDPETNQMSGSCVFLDQTNFTLVIPYFTDGKVINLYDPAGKKVFFASVEHLAKSVCGDSVCQKSESHKVCPQDCPVNMIDTTKTNDKFSTGMLIGIIIAIMAVVVGIVFILKKKKENTSGMQQ